MTKRFLKSIAAAAVVALALVPGVAVGDVLNSFDTAGDTAGWAKDRFDPQVFQSGVSGGGRSGVLQLGIREEGAQTFTATGDVRTGGFDDAFYNYQGKFLALGSGIDNPAEVSIDMYVDSSWKAGTRAGMWATNSNGNLSYPIIEYLEGTGLRYWQSDIGNWTNAGAVADGWHNIAIKLDGALVRFFLDGNQFATSSALGAHQIENVILQGHNQGEAEEYDIFFDNFSAAAVTPTPVAATAGLVLMGLTALKRRRAC